MLRSKLYIVKKNMLLLVLISVLVLLRFFEADLFYDPFTAYFKTEFLHQPYPNYNLFKLGFNLIIRYFLNSLISVGVIYVVFQNVSMVKMTAMLLSVFLVILLILVVVLLTFFDHHHAMTFFYVRRFLIQPLFLLLFIPGFYYQQKKS